jgi:hypothetical protein
MEAENKQKGKEIIKYTDEKKKKEVKLWKE